MALNFTISYTFSPSTTISSSQVNTNESDIAGVFTGLEAETKTLAKLKVDIDPTLALEVATKQYVDHYSTYRRPVLQYASGTVVNIETGINGTSGQAAILFPDGTLRTDSTTGRINCNLAQAAVLSGTAQSGLQTGTVTNNTWYAVYAVKVTDSSTNFVTVADKTNLPVQASYSTINTNFGTSGWVYLGSIRYGDQGNTANAIVKFVQSGNMTNFSNANAACTIAPMTGLRFGGSASATAASYTYAAGTAGAQIPAHIPVLYWTVGAGGGTVQTIVKDVGATYTALEADGTHGFVGRAWMPSADGVVISNTSAVAMDLMVSGFIDGVLGVGSNPIL